jgi:ubiquitin-conjugating enzyme E2 J1
MDTNAKGQIGGIECSKEARERMARESGGWTCPGCNKSNADIMQERAALVKEIEEKEGKRKEEEVPEELRLAYRDELSKGGEDDTKEDKGKGRATEATSSSAGPSTAAIPSLSSARNAPVIRPTRTTPAAPRLQQVAQTSPDLAWIDTCIYGLVAALLFMVVKKFV